MIIKITPPQVAEYWELVKFGIVHGDLVSEDHRQVVLNEILQALLSETAQCFFRLDDQHRVIALMITRIQISKVSGDRFLYIQCIYSFRQVANLEWHEDWNYLQTFASQNDCKYIDANSANPVIFQLLDSLGAKELYRTYRFKV